MKSFSIVALFSISLSFFAPVLSLHAAEPPSAQEKPSGLKSKLEEVFGTFLQRELKIETLTWRFPTSYTAKNLTLWEKPGVLMAQAPVATMRVSLRTLVAFRYHIAKMRFKEPRATLRFTHDGKSNLTDMVNDLVRHANAIRKPGQRQKAKYNVFQIDNAQLDVVDMNTGLQPFRQPFIVNAKGDIDGFGPQTHFPFRLTAVHTSTITTPMRAELYGTMSNRPTVHLKADNIPLWAGVDYLPILRRFDGGINAKADFSKAGGYIFSKVAFSADNIRTNRPGAFPKISVEGLAHMWAPSTLKVVLDGKPTRIDVLVKVLSFRSKKVTLAVKSEAAELKEVIEWLRTGSLLNERPGASAPPIVWKVSGKADVAAELKSVMGPRLIHDVDGQIIMRVRDGVLSEMPGFIKALTKINLSSVLSPGNETTGLKFNNVNGIIDITNGVATTRDLIFLESPTLDLGVMGRVDFVKQTIDARMLVGIVSVPEDVVRKIPLVSRFGAEKKGVIPIWLSIKGSLQNPAIEVLSLKSFNRRLWQTLPPGLRLPDEEIKKIY